MRNLLGGSRSLGDVCHLIESGIGSSSMTGFRNHFVYERNKRNKSLWSLLNVHPTRAFYRCGIPGGRPIAVLRLNIDGFPEVHISLLVRKRAS